MNVTKGTSLLLLMSLLVFASCQKKDDDANVIINIEEEFDVQLLEDLIPGANKLLVFVRTKEELDCSNYDLGHSHAVSKDKVVISIDELELEGGCVEGKEFVKADIHVGNLDAGSYELQINLSLNSITNKGILSIFNNHYRMVMETSHGITLLSQSLKKIPDNYFWGYFQLIDGNETEVRDAFYDALQNYATPSALEDGHYGYFDLENGVSKLNPVPLNLYTAPSGSFIHQRIGSKMDLMEMVKDFQTNYEGKIKIVLYTSEGEIL